MVELKQKPYYVDALMLLCDWRNYMVMNKVNGGVFVECCCDKLVKKMKNCMCKLGVNGH
jgi:hypothetical protein